MAGALAEEVARVLDVEDPIALWHEGLAKLDARVDAALDMWREIIVTMPPIRNVALRDTLASRDVGCQLSAGAGDSAPLKKARMLTRFSP